MEIKKKTICDKQVSDVKTGEVFVYLYGDNYENESRPFMMTNNKTKVVKLDTGYIADSAVSDSPVRVYKTSLILEV